MTNRTILSNLVGMPVEFGSQNRRGWVRAMWLDAEYRLCLWIQEIETGELLRCDAEHVNRVTNRQSGGGQLR